MRATGGVLVLVAACAACAACGRVGFDPTGAGAADATGPAVDAAPLDFGAGCIVGLEMNETSWVSDPLIDSCGGDNPGVAAGMAASVTDPVRGRVGQFGGPTDCVEVVDAPELDVGAALTMSAWIYPTGLDGVTPRGVIARRTDSQVDVIYTMFVWTDDHVTVNIDSENDEMLGNAVIVNNQWQMITAVYDGAQPLDGRIRVYVDGLLDRVLPETSASIPPSPLSLIVGCLPQTAPLDQQSFAGRIDDVALWSRAFTAPEVQAWYDATRR